MKTKLYVAVVLGGALLFVAGNLTASGAGSLSENTQANLSTAIHGEAFASFASEGAVGRAVRIYKNLCSGRRGKAR